MERASSEPTIPKILHYVWVGGAPLPSRFQRNIESWVRHNPDYKLILWDDSNVERGHPFIEEAYRQQAWAKLSDMVRLLAVARFGGIYLDTDIEVIRPLDPLLQHNCVFGFQSCRPEDEPVGNAAFGAIAGHWLLNEILAEFPVVDGRDLNTIGTGPELVSASLRRLGLPEARERNARVADVDVFRTKTFYPYHWLEAYKPSCVESDTLTIHHWEMSWHHSRSKSPLRRLQNSMKEYPSIYRPLRNAYRSLRELIS